MPYIALSPVTYRYGHSAGPGYVHGAYTVETPDVVGSTEFVDGADSSYVILSGGRHGPSGPLLRPVDMDFVLPEGIIPTAIAYYARLATNPNAQAFDPEIGDSRGFETVLMDRNDGFLENDSYSTSHFDALLVQCTQFDPVDVNAYWWDVDLNNPTDAGYWLEFTGSWADDIVAALTGDGIRVSFFVDHAGDYNNELANLYEFKLLVAYEEPVGQLYVNLSTDQNAPNWVSACEELPPTEGQSGAYAGYFNVSENPAVPDLRRVHYGSSGGTAGGSGGSSGYVYWSESDAFVTRWNTATDEVSYGIFDGESIGALVAGASKLWVNAYGSAAGFEVDLDMGNRTNWTIPSANLHDDASGYDKGGIYDPVTEKFWLHAVYEPDYDPWPEFSWVSFNADGTFDAGHCDDNPSASGAEVAFGTSPAIVDGWLYRNSNVATKIDRYNLSTGAWEYVELQRSGGGSMALQVIGYHASYGLIVYNTITGNYEGRDPGDWTWWDMSDYGGDPGGTLAAASQVWTPPGSIGTSNAWGHSFVNDGAIYCVVRDGVSGVDYGWGGTVGGVSPTAWGWQYSIKSIDLATGTVTTRLQIPYRWVDATGAPTSEMNSGYETGGAFPFGFTGTPIASVWNPIYANVSTDENSPLWYPTCSHIP